MVTRKTRANAASPLPIELYTIPGLTSLAHQLRSWTDNVLTAASTAADMSMPLARNMLPKAKEGSALALLRDARERAGLTVKELSEAIDLRDPALLESIEAGRGALPFEVALRIAAVLGRNDPLAFAMNLTRSANPELWQRLEQLGIGRLIVQAGRERELANIYRANDAARKLDDGEFAAVLGFTKAAFDMAMVFRETGQSAKLAEGAAKRRAARKKA